MNKKIYLIPLLSVLFIVLFVLVYLTEKEKKELDYLHNAGILVQELKIDTLTLRRNEKDFLSRNKKNYVEAFHDNYLFLQKNIAQLQNYLKLSNINTTLLFDFSNSLNTYENSFNFLVQKKFSFGLHEKDAEYLQLRSTAHKLLELGQNNSDLMVDILILRRNEKDFFLRKDLQYKKLFFDNYNKSITRYSDKTIQNLLNKYSLHFRSLVDLQIAIGLNESLGYTGLMRDAVHKSEEILSVVSKRLFTDINAKSSELKNLANLLFISILFIVVFIILVLVKLFTSQSKVHQLTSLTNQLSNTLQDLEKTQDKLVESEKLASLGGLVAGVAHEINTPLGIALTGVTYFDEITINIKSLYNKEEMSKDDFESYLNKSQSISTQVLTNIQRASNLIQTFKQVSTDQTNEKMREFNIKDYTDGIILSINSQLKKTNIKIINSISEEIIINSYPGAFGQIVTNLILNSIIHGYSSKEKGIITLNIIQKKEKLVFEYKDDGKGISKKDLPHIFEPFFTTARGQGGTGLGLNILYNIVRKQFDGEITCTSEQNHGVNFSIVIPLKLQKTQKLYL